MKIKIVLSLMIFCLISFGFTTFAKASFYKGNDTHLLYMGRVEILNSQPRLWTAGAYFRFAFSGDTCKVILEDELRYGVEHNYIEIQVDNDQPIRLRLNNKVDTINVIPSYKRNIHQAIICKDTETGIGYVGVNGIIVDQLLNTPKRKGKLFEFWGDSITCGASSDTSSVGCGKGRWEDQHNAYMSYGAQTARKLDADWVLSSVSGIGLMHSCCDMKIIIPQVWDKMDMRNDSLSWDFSILPNVVFVCLGQNDGIQDKITFYENYISFLKQLRTKYANQPIVLLTSPMADAKLRAFLKEEIKDVIEKGNANGLKNLYSYTFEKSYNGGCDYHPSVVENKEISDLLVRYIKNTKGIL
ncbi:SGNH/GDSL hydrolase family protein [Rhizosphaericola mali]|uniref:Acetyl xylan esterase n=1 Tax=Rhizosphaericola mali TaxID=2545455 RepID=A0A5P2G3Q6_9BACT|nr:SGNH/GDSL hydrolase family protein [Rhizosphaericola mali]QES89837.1 acetyl xylan esterase [Rhizosphaericola mali]